MERPRREVADIFRRYGAAYRAEHESTLSSAQRRILQAIETCRTAALGGHVEQCDACQHRRIAYNSCRNRHCPKCQSLARAAWIEQRQAELLDCAYFHVVFTLPKEIASLAYQNKALVYNLLFAATAETLRTIASDPKHLGAEIGFFAILHTWGQTLMHHPHLHCLVPCGLQRIRYYGFLDNRHRREKLAQCRRLLQMSPLPTAMTETSTQDYRDRDEALTGVSLHQCPLCRQGRMMIVEPLKPSGLPSPGFDTS